MVPAETAYAKILCADDLIRSDCISRFVEIAETDQAIEVVLSQDIFFEENVHRANLSSESTIFDGVAIIRAAMNDSINWLPYQHLFIRLHDYDRCKPIFEPRPIFFDAAAVFSRLRQGKFAYLHEPLVYTRWHNDFETSKYLSGEGRFRCLLDTIFSRPSAATVGMKQRIARNWIGYGVDWLELFCVKASPVTTQWLENLKRG